MKHYYPAVFMPGVECYEVIMPHINCFTQGTDIAECMAMAQDAIGVMFKDVAEADYPAPSKLTDIDISAYPAGSFVTYVCFDKEAYEESVKLNEREAILNADNPIRELLDRRHMKIKQLADLLQASYRTVQDWSLGKSKPPAWCLKLIVDKVLD